MHQAALPGGRVTTNAGRSILVALLGALLAACGSIH
jgi:hypothetical protein